MKIIDYEKKGNMVKFFLGDDNLTDWYGDDWDDRPYDCNAGQVYDEFIVGTKVGVFNFDDIVLEPCNTYDSNCCWSKDDMKNRRVPCIVVLKKADIDDNCYTNDNFNHVVTNDKAIKIYLGDEVEDLWKLCQEQII